MRNEVDTSDLMRDQGLFDGNCTDFQLQFIKITQNKLQNTKPVQLEYRP